MIDNFSAIAAYLNNTKGKCFYVVQIIRRGKDHPNLPSANRVIKTYFIESSENLLKYKDEMISLSEAFKARIYINLAPKSYEKLAKLTNFKLSERIYNGDYKKIYNCFTSCAGELKGETEAWVIDIDCTEEDCGYFQQKVIAIYKWLEEWFSMYNLFREAGSDAKSVKMEIPTVNGIHLITSSFHLLDFKKNFPDVDVHKNNPTLLYANF